ncbi:hypothetical protein EV360DRAFT_49822 [Lentinula raphanica]|nr:hypothetical protein EV360DRAFT_49822 [Lentinula raphanica]
MTASYAFTDYRAQGQTIPLVIVDIARVPTGALTLTSIYVALSRSTEPELMMEDKRLEDLHDRTRKWWDEKRDRISVS